MIVNKAINVSLARFLDRKSIYKNNYVSVILAANRQ